MPSRIRVLIQVLERPDGADPGPPVEYTGTAVFIGTKQAKDEETFVEMIGAGDDLVQCYASITRTVINDMGQKAFLRAMIEAERTREHRVIYDSSKHL